MENIWDTEFFKIEEGAFIKFEPGVERILKWVDVVRKEQSPNAKFPTPDGTVLQLEFAEGNVKKFFTANSGKNKLLMAMKAANIQLGDSFAVTRTGSEFETDYEVRKIEGKDVEIPF